MATFRSVYVQLTCERCEAPRRAAVQFETGRDRLEEYEAGERVHEDRGLRRGESYAGSAARYCDPCFRVWACKEAEAQYQSLAELVQEGRLAIKPKDAPAPLSPREILALGVKRVADVMSGPLPPWGESFAKYDLTWDGRLASPSIGPHLDLLESLVDKKLKGDGWERGIDWLREDLRVSLDGESRIHVEAPPGSAPPRR